jgi:Alpha amylase, catalytic domain
MEFHISRALRERLDLDDALFSYTGNVVFGNVAASRKLAQKLNDARGTEADPERVANAGALFAMGLIDELNHALVARYREEIDPSVLREAIRWFEAQSTPADGARMLLAFTEQFPNMAVYRGNLSAAEWLKGTTDGLPNREAAMEELMLLWLANSNPAFGRYRELFEDSELKKQTVYQTVTATLPDYFVTRPPISAEFGSLLDVLRAPFNASPDSLTGQLDFIRANWSKYLGQDLRRVLLAIDVLREEDLAIWMRFHPPGPDRYRHGAPGRGGEGFVGDEYIGFDEEWVVGPDGVRHRRYAADYQAPLNEYEAFSADQAWMPNVVLMAKSTYVWLEQLSKKYGRHIHRLDQIPDEELRLLARRGITGLWLIGLWERSTASQTIKRLRGHHDAVASAYSLKGYSIAEDLGGNAGYDTLRHRAAAAGIRLASDMVPNHMGIDSDWVIEHPDWFLFRWESPFPVYRFEGPDLSNDSRVEIKIEDHYYEQTDAAVVFRLRHYREGTTRYVYHGNDGTTFAWNDTAQLDYSKAFVREHVIQAILHVARLFPIIRFDAAMVLAKRHVQRLWFPLPGAGGSIPSRSENAMSQEEFDALMPHEFWREVVDRVAVEVPGTLLLAEAFWLLEGYFVRTLGMHRVYNSAFMNMLRDEENAKYRSYLKKTIEFDPDILKRYVNFMSNPDERTAIDQFGSGDKYFGVCTLLATLPGLPMFGHGQIEGYTERYGMEFKQAKMDERPNEGLAARHEQDIAPLLHNRRLFAESVNFVLYDFWGENGTVDENVFAYSNRLHDQRGVILYNNSYGSTRGTIHLSVGAWDKGSGTFRQRSLVEGLGLHVDDSMIVAYRDTARGLEYLRRATDFDRYGLGVDLRGYQHMVLLDWRQLRSTEEQPWDKLCDALNGAGVYSVNEALSKLRLRPLHEALRHAVSARTVATFVEISQELAKAKDVREAIPKIEASEKAEVRGKLALLVDGSAAGVVAPETERAVLDSRLQEFVEKSQHFFDRAVEIMPAEDREAMFSAAKKTAVPAGVSTSAAVKDEQARDPRQSYKEKVEEMAKAAVQLLPLEQNFSTSWPAAGRSLLPHDDAETHPERTWAAVLGWIVLGSMPWKHEALFDKLQMRAAIAEIFSSMGLEGEDMWRAAARVRVLLTQSCEAAAKAGETLVGCMHREAFWADGDVQWLTGVNKSAGATYFNKEGFEEMISWLQLPALIEIARRGGGAGKAIAELEAGVVEDCRVAAESGYQLDTYLSAWKPKGVKVSKVAKVSEEDVKRDLVASQAVGNSTVDGSAASATELPEVVELPVDAGKK